MTDVATEGEGHRIGSSDAAPRPDQRAEVQTKRRVWPWIVLLLIAGGAYLWWQRSADAPQAKAGGAPAARPVPVVAAKARVGDLPIYIDGLGTVTAFNTVTVRTRVDGELIKVAFTEGQPVHEGDLLCEIDPRPFEVQLSQAEGQLARDQALLQNAKLDWNRYQEAREAVPRQQIDTAAANVAQYEAATKVDQSQVDSAKLQLVYCHITSPLNGVIGLRLVDQGNTVHASDPSGLATITQLEPIAVQFSIPQDYLPDVMQAMKKGELAAEAYDRDMKKEIARGKLMAVDNQINASTGTVKLKAVFDNKDRSLFPNQFVNVRLLVDVKKGVVLIPTAAVQRSPKTTFVYVVKDDDMVEVRPVTIGPTEHEIVAIMQGLKGGETVVTDGVDKLQEGTKVTSRDEAGAADDAQPDGGKKPANSGDGATPSGGTKANNGAKPGSEAKPANGAKPGSEKKPDDGKKKDPSSGGSSAGKSGGEHA
jgi:multidrug efflux system membrane fusion protein